MKLFNDDYLTGIIHKWDSNFPANCCLNKRELEQALPSRIKNLRKNIFNVAGVLYQKGRVSLFDIDMALENESIELGGRSIGISNILDNLKERGVLLKVIIIL